MANELDELTGPVNEEGQDINVISKQLKVKVGWGSTLFEVLLWFPLIIPGVIFLFKKIQAKNTSNNYNNAFNITLVKSTTT